LRLLLDTHVVLWWLNDSAELSAEARNAIGEPENLVYVSAVSIWEIVIKRTLGKLGIPAKWADVLEEEPFRQLPLMWEHALKVRELPGIHSDPFDRLLVAQVKVEDLVLVTRDDTLLRYEITALKT